MHSPDYSPAAIAKATGRPASRGGFTLIELLVVVSIIVVLIGILIPTLGHVRTQARETQTKALMSNLVTDLETYYTTFHDYPGPMPVAATTGGSKIMSGAQNMLLGLSYAMQNTNTAAPNVQIGSTGVYVDPTRPSGPINYAVQRPDGSFDQLSPYFSPTAKQLSPATAGNTWPAGGVVNSNGGKFAFPVVLDAFPDALPILYYRRSRGVDTPIASDNPASKVAGYYLDENKEYTTATNLVALDGSTYDQTQRGLGTSMYGVADLAMLAEPELEYKDVTNPNASTHGSYLLVAAGRGRVYGHVIDPPRLPVYPMPYLRGTTDSIAIVGGH